MRSQLYFIQNDRNIHTRRCFISFLQLPGTLKAKLAKLRSELFMEQSGGGGGGGPGEGFDVARNGDARVALIGFPSVGKSSLLNQMTTTESEAAGYGTFERSPCPLFC